MKRLLVLLLWSGLLPSCQLPQSGAPAKGESYFVEKVIDGDTFIIEGGEKVRLIGIDAPETPQSYKQRNFRYGLEAKAYLTGLIESREVWLEFDVEKKDRYGRLLAYVWLEEGELLNAHLVQEGYARAVRYAPNLKYQDELSRLQEEARQASRGLWAEASGRSGRAKKPAETNAVR